MADHEPLVQTLTIPVSAKARLSAVAWAEKWEVKKSQAFRAIYRRGLIVAAARPFLPAYPRHYEAQCSFRVPAYLLMMGEACKAKQPDWELTSVMRAAFYLGLLEVQKDGQMTAPVTPPVARNREALTIPA